MIKSQSMNFVMETMMDIAEEWETSKWKSKDDMINPNAPMIVQIGDFGYEVQSCGGDGDIEGFVIMCKPEPVCEWRGMECIKLKGKA